MNSLQMVRWF